MPLLNTNKSRTNGLIAEIEYQVPWNVQFSPLCLYSLSKTLVELHGNEETI